jgi:hypothetical protein
MGELSMKRKVWTSEETERARELLKKYSYATVGKMLHRSKNSVIGQFYREKVMNGYTPDPFSKYTRKKERNIHVDN